MVWKAVHMNQGDLAGGGEPVRSQSVHSSLEAGQCPWSEGTQEGGCVSVKHWESQPVDVSLVDYANRRGPHPLGLVQARGQNRAHVDGPET